MVVVRDARNPGPTSQFISESRSKPRPKVSVQHLAQEVEPIRLSLSPTTALRSWAMLPNCEIRLRKVRRPARMRCYCVLLGLYVVGCTPALSVAQTSRGVEDYGHW